MLDNMSDHTVITEEDIFRTLCRSTQGVLNSATNSGITFSPIAQVIYRTCLHPDIGCFSLFSGDLTGLVIMNFTKEAALEIYRNYMAVMGVTENIALSHTSNEVSDTLGELMNQCIGRFRNDLNEDLGLKVNQNQPKMLVLPEVLEISVETGIKNAQLRKFFFSTNDFSRFYVEVAFGKIEFYQLFTGEASKKLHKPQTIDTDALFDKREDNIKDKKDDPPEESDEGGVMSQNELDSLFD